MSKEIAITHLTIQYFLCGICKEVAYEPVECKMCEQLFCNLCLVDYLNNSQDSCCPLGCPDPLFEKTGHAFEKLMSFIYTKCKTNGCLYEDCIKHIQKHEQVCRHRQQKMEIEVPADLLAQRDMFWLQILNKVMTPTQYSSNSLQPGQFNAYPGSLLSATPKSVQTFKF